MFFVLGAKFGPITKTVSQLKGDFTFNLQIHCTVVYLTYSGTYNTYTFYIHKYIAKQYGYLALNREQSEFYPGGHHK